MKITKFRFQDYEIKNPDTDKVWKAFTVWASIIGVGIVCLLSSCSMTPARADDLPSNERIAQAIYHAENSKKFPYGIKSINTYGNKEYARKICLNSIRNAKKRWIKAGMPGDFISFMGRRFSPPEINPNWVRLVKHFLGE